MLDAHAVGTVVFLPAHGDVDVRVLFCRTVNATPRAQTAARAVRRRPVLRQARARDEAPYALAGPRPAGRQLFFHTALITKALACGRGTRGQAGTASYHTAETDAASDATRMMPITRADVCWPAPLPMHCAAAEDFRWERLLTAMSSAGRKVKLFVAGRVIRF